MPKTILLADDSVTIQKVVELTFMEEDYEVVAVSSGEEALARLDEVDPDLVVADVHMPGPSGFEVCREVKQRRPEVPVLLLVGTFEPFDPSEGEAAGADQHLKKPFDSQELLQTVRDLVPADVAGAEAGPASADDGEIEWPEDAEATAEENAAAEAGLEADTEELAAVSLAAAATEVAAVEEAAGSGESSEVASQAGDDAADTVALSDTDVERVARRVVELLSDDRVREVAWEVVPDLAEVVIKDRLRELESQVE